MPTPFLTSVSLPPSHSQTKDGPGIGDDHPGSESDKVDLNDVNSTTRRPLALKGILDQFKSFECTPVIGTEFPDANLAEWITAPNSDELLRDLAITVSQRGVVFFRKQDFLTIELQKELAQRLGELVGKPKSSTLHIHPLSNFGSANDGPINIISTDQKTNPVEDLFRNHYQRRGGNLGNWHSDISYEPVPSDYVVLRMTQLPKTGGDTLWASACEVYDRISPPYRKFLESLTATLAQTRYKLTADSKGFEIHTEERGSPENVGSDLMAVHPVIRSNPVTGWRSLYAVGHHFQHINGLTPDESNQLHDWFLSLIVHNHDLQVRNRWQNSNDVAIWDNRSVFHAATFDYEGLGPRTGYRVVGIGERPYLDPNSMSRREALAQLHSSGASPSSC